MTYNQIHQVPRGMRDSSPAKHTTVSRRDAAGRMTMKKMLKSAVVAAAVAVMVLVATTARAQEKDIVDTAVAAGSFKTLAAALTAGDLIQTLKGKGPFTVFAPTDEAFAKLPAATLADLLKPENKAKLVAILTYHVVPGKVMASQVTGLKSAKTVNGQSVKISVMDGGVMIDNAHVVKTDIATSNGVIHVIDAVLLPSAK
jgi:transforming growth factor-beta-induced protein